MALYKNENLYCYCKCYNCLAFYKHTAIRYNLPVLLKSSNKKKIKIKNWLSLVIILVTVLTLYAVLLIVMIITEMQVKRKHGAESFNQLPKTYDNDSNGDVIMANLPKKVFLSVGFALWFYIFSFFCSILVFWMYNVIICLLFDFICKLKQKSKGVEQFHETNFVMLENKKLHEQ